MVCATVVRGDEIAVFCKSGMLMVGTELSIVSGDMHPLIMRKNTIIVEDMIAIRLDVFIDVSISRSPDSR
jgi:hypothetical protein